MLVDIVVRNHEVVSARPTKEMAPPIILVRTTEGHVLPAIKWPSYSTSGLSTRFENRVYGRLKVKALKQAYKIVRENGGLDIAGEYGSIEISKKDFEADLKIQS